MNEKLIRYAGMPLVQSEGLYFCTVHSMNGIFSEFGVHMRHGAPAGAFYKNRTAIKSFSNRKEANEFIDELAGVSGASEHFKNEFFYN